MAGQTVAETATFLKFAKEHLSEAERLGLIEEIAENPKQGDILVGTGGMRKFRFATKGRGKSGSVRIVSLYVSEDWPVYLIFGFAKNEKSNLDTEDTKLLKSLTDKIKTAARAKRKY